ncbi:hypothetical protein C8A05DRAFT_35692 [Staphylotrichum tortipilum]|uniref:Uncharacterized protein n=1 Tax=Staphylotrichum tortipilum TaxID=2831512 RepID=A0AAN6RSM7_9PEZI|nr:hypothetical protein C8A05DRAFT_35692 [Staphylotrichum longicolle]
MAPPATAYSTTPITIHLIGQTSPTQIVGVLRYAVPTVTLTATIPSPDPIIATAININMDIKITTTTATTTDNPKDTSTADPNPATTSNPHTSPTTFYDTPTQAFAVGFFLAAAASIMLWIGGFMIKVWATWMWRAMGGVVRGFGGAALLGG